MKRVYEYYDSYEKIISVLVDFMYTVSMTVLIFLGHNVPGFIETHPYRLFASLFMAFGILSYEIKKQTMKKMILDLTSKFFATLLAAIIIAKLTGTVNVKGMYSVIYPIIVIFIYGFINRKSNWTVNGKIKSLSSRKYLSEKFGSTVSAIPILLLFTALVLPGIFNVSIIFFVLSLLVAFVLENIIVYILEKKKLKRSNPGYR